VTGEGLHCRPVAATNTGCRSARTVTVTDHRSAVHPALSNELYEDGWNEVILIIFTQGCGEAIMTKILTKNEVDDLPTPVEEDVLTHPLQWEITSPTESERLSEYGLLRVERIRFECWVAYRDDCALMGGCGQVQFDTRRQAQSTADRHERDGCAATDRPHDGLFWSNLTKPRPWAALVSGRSSGCACIPAETKNAYLSPAANSLFRGAVP
jgi:hypothetical protein